MSPPAAFVDELAAVGVSVESPWDLVNSRRSYRSAIPVLIEWLDRVDLEVPAHERASFREALVRSLAVKDARGVAAPVLLREFQRLERKPGYRWAVGNALEVAADDAVFDDVVELVRDRSYGRDRQMLVLSLARMKDPRAVEVLTALLDDDTVAGHAVMALGRLNASQARPAIEQCLTHSQPWVRREAKMALAKLDA